MPATWIQVQFVNPPKPGKNPKYGSLKTDVGYVSVPTAELGLFQKGGRYCIEMETTDQGFNNFVRMANQQPSNSAPAPRPQYPQRTQAAQPIARTLPPRPAPQAQQRPAPKPIEALSFSAQVDDQARAIFITGIVGRAMGCGRFEATDILTLTHAAAEAYDVVFRGKPLAEQPQLTAEQAFDDDLPNPDQYGARPHDHGDDQDIPY